MICATLNASYSLALSSTRSTSSPIIVSLSTISASEALVSRCSFSQDSVNFMPQLPDLAFSDRAEGRQFRYAPQPIDTPFRPRLRQPTRTRCSSLLRGTRCLLQFVEEF